MYIQGLLRNEEECLIQNDCNRGETNSSACDQNILVSTRKECFIDANRQSVCAQWMLNEILLRVLYQCTLIVTNKYVSPLGPSKTHFHKHS